MTFLTAYSPNGRSIEETAHLTLSGDLRPVHRSSDHRFCAWRKDSDATQSASVLMGDDQVCVIGRIRLDRREELRLRLSARHPELLPGADDAHLCLVAYLEWGDAFTEELHGDFSFVVWSQSQQSIVLARDRMGVRSLFAYQAAGILWVTDSLRLLEPILQRSDLSLNPDWLADFIRYGVSTDPTATAYMSVKRVAPGHRVTVSPLGTLNSTYWRLELGDPLVCRSADEYVERFHELLDASLRDRLPATGNIGVMMSGGLDSSTLAAKTVELTGDPRRVIALTSLNEQYGSDPERHFSSIVASYLGIEHRLISLTSVFDVDWRRHPRPMEPSLAVTVPPSVLHVQMQARSSARVWLYGEGPDNALTFEWRNYLSWLIQRRDWGGVVNGVGSYLTSKSPADWLTTFRSRLQPCGDPSVQGHDFSWLRQPERAPDSDPNPGSWRPRAMAGFGLPQWQSLFEAFNLEGEDTGAEWRHPFLDLRMLTFMLSTPTIPWSRHKLLLRTAMKGRLPREILQRSKSPLGMDPVERQLGEGPALDVEPDGPVGEFVDLARLRQIPLSCLDSQTLLRVSVLDHWLNHRPV